MKILFIIFVIVELYYWFIYFPRAFKNNSNPQINDNDIKHYMNVMIKYHKNMKR